MKILIAGEGGQGIQTAARILAESAYHEGKEVVYIPNFGVEQRGGFSIAFVIIDSQPITYPKFETADILAVMTDKVMTRVKKHQGEKTIILKNTSNLALLKELVEKTKIVKPSTLEAVTNKKLAGKIKR